jgi:hypothetical protein
LGALRVDGAKCVSQIDSTHGFVKAAVCNGEVLSAHRLALTRQPFAQVAERRLRGTCSLVAKLRITDGCVVNGLREGFGSDVDLQTLEWETIVMAHGRDIDARGCSVALS